MKKALYKNIEIVPYWNGYKVYYRHENGTLEQVAFQMTKADAIKAGKAQVDHINGKK